MNHTSIDICNLIYFSSVNQVKPNLDTFFKNYKTLLLKGKTVFIGGDESHVSYIYYLKRGIAKQYAVSSRGDEVVLNMFRPISCFPLVHLFPSIQNHSYFETVSNVELIRAPISEFLLFLKGNPLILLDLAEILAHAFYDTSNMIECFMLGRAHNRVVMALLIYARKFGECTKKGERIINMPLTHKNIGALVGLTRETVSREMEHLERKKIVTKRNGLVCISNMRGLIDETLLL